MLSVEFDYLAPENLEIAVALLKNQPDSVILAGSYSLISEMKQGNIAPSRLVDLRKISSLKGINFLDAVLKINAMTTYGEVLASLDIKKQYPALFAKNIGDPQIRNVQSIGDIFAYRDLACDLTAVALAMEATFETIYPEGSHTIEAEELIKVSFQNNWQPKEIITSINLPIQIGGTGSAYQAFKHPATGYTLCGVAALAGVNNGIINKCRIALTGATPYAVRLTEVEAAMEGKAPTEANIEAGATLAQESVNTIIGDRYASAEYRAHLMEVIAKRTLMSAIERAGVIN